MTKGKSADKHLLKQLSKADYVTALSIACIVNAFALLWHGYTNLAVSLAFVSMFLDYVDGLVARKYGGSPYGAVLDSLYDVMGWVLFPAMVINIQADWAWWSILVTTLFSVFGLLRLSRFTVAGYVKTDARYYRGLPVLFSKYALLVALWLNMTTLAVVWLAVMIPLMVSSRLVRKPHPILAQLELVYAAIFLWLHIR
jgi:CDP-diacylglycerol---serine O-phosphatidyltransferase